VRITQMHPSRGSSACREQASVLASPAAASMRSRSYAASPGGRSPGHRTCRLYHLPVARGRTGRWHQLHQDWHGSPASRGGCLRGTDGRRFADGCLGQVPTHEGSRVRSIACWIANRCGPHQRSVPLAHAERPAPHWPDRAMFRTERDDDLLH
jgi:hypothetical protein